ncbi:oxidoreductase [Aspergillus heteromorphus CBS 117.55]|uniref:Oxidoreductase n=1 Tax=Aspergillus heteromorphus CBS 117.55 TaxID=1448321 RepID=A0A317WSA3_9EURO|nr:oxidoreductase [Aspergillus heteromorphus CBS 117.55]PWY89249.1 oxidoreductase [Aspergillus heteromorphus CBS 117.55]
MSNHISTNKLAHHRVLLLGGTSGVGFTVARGALEHGANIVVSSSNPEKVLSAVARLKALYPEPSYTSRVAGFACDLGDQTTMEANLVALLEYATAGDLFPTSTSTSLSGSIEKKERIPLNHIIYTAGSRPDPLPITSPTLTASTFSQHTTVRLLAPILIAKHSPTYLSTAQSSSITFTSGVLALKPHPGMTLGAAAATALEGLTRGLAVELAPVRVNTVMLGAVETELFDAFGEQRETYLGVFRKGTLSGEVGRPGDVAEAYLWCMKDWFVTGERVGTDGGWMLKSN